LKIDCRIQNVEQTICHSFRERQQLLDSAGTKTARKKSIQRAIESVAEKLGNTNAVSRKCYIHPAIIDAYSDGSLSQLLRRRTIKTKGWRGLEPEEAAVLTLLRRKRRLDTKESKSNLRRQLKKSPRARKVQNQSRFQ
jgi:DNA topoisomerase-1